MREKFMPVSMDDLSARGLNSVDFVLVTGDAYVDHPSFGMSIIGRSLEKEGFTVAILAQPDWKSTQDFTRFGKPNLAFLVTAGNLDSMVNHYTAAKKPRSSDVYSPGGKAGLRPDRATLAYCNRIRQVYPKVPLIIGGVEASLRRFSHYDYWENSVRRSILFDSGADILVFGMGERAIAALAKRLSNNEKINEIDDIPGICYHRPLSQLANFGGIILPSHDEVKNNNEAHAQAFSIQAKQQDPVRGIALMQPCGGRAVVQNPPAMPLTRQELDRVYSLSYVREAHPDYDKDGGVPALEEVQFSITATRGCFGSCAFCSIGFHQGRIVQSRSNKSIVNEARLLTLSPCFKGYIHDIGGPTANFRQPACKKQLTEGACEDRACLFPKPCPKFNINHKEMMESLRDVRELAGVKKAFVRSGIRYDALMCDSDKSLLREICQHHVSGQLKVAPEHVSNNVLALMGKPGSEVFEKFSASFYQINEDIGKKQYLVPYFISGHPGAKLEDAIELACYMKKNRLKPEQVQDFYPTPGTAATVMYATGLNPATLKPIYVARNASEKAMQRALLQYTRKENAGLVRKALISANRSDLIGFSPHCLVKPENKIKKNYNKYS